MHCSRETEPPIYEVFLDPRRSRPAPPHRTQLSSDHVQEPNLKTSNNRESTTCQNLTPRRRPRGWSPPTLDVPAHPNTVSAFLNLRVADIQRVYEEWSAKPLAPSTNKPNGDTDRHIRRTQRLGSKEIGQYG
jgi:hypothetical protein